MPSTWKCLNCGRLNPPAAAACLHCDIERAGNSADWAENGNRLPSPDLPNGNHCWNCSAELTAGATNCHACDASQSKTADDSSGGGWVTPMRSLRQDAARKLKAI